MHIGIFCLFSPSHIQAMCGIGRELKSRGHRVTVFQVRDFEKLVLGEGLEYFPIGENEYPAGRIKEVLAELGKRSGREGLKYSMEQIKLTALMVCREAGPAIQKSGVEGLIIDQGERAAPAFALDLGIPFVTVSAALPMNRESVVPPPFTRWSYNDNLLTRLRNKVGYFLMDRITRQVRQAVASYRQELGLPVYTKPGATYSKLAQLTQLPPALDFPRKELPDCFHYTGLCRTQTPATVEFPYDKLDGRPLIYASLGTLHGQHSHVFRLIAEACADLPEYQLIISLGGSGRITDAEFQNLPGTPIVVEFAPQLELLALPQMKLVITHGGLNSVLETVSFGLPMVVIPINGDQNGVAARIKWSGTGEFVPVKKLTETKEKLAASIKQVLGNGIYLANAIRLRQSNLEAGGMERACDIIEQAFGSKQPVLQLSGVKQPPPTQIN